MTRQKGGVGRVYSRVQRSPRFGAPERRIRSDEDTALIQIESKSPKEFAKKIREWMRKPGEMGILSITKQKANRQRDVTSLQIHTEKRSGRATPEIFLFCLSLAGGSFTHVVRVHVELLTP